MSQEQEHGRRGSVDLRFDVPHSARVYDYILGGKTNYEADRAAGDASKRVWPALPVSMRQNRQFMIRAVRHLAAEHGVRQFLDIGTGIPTSPNLHEVVQAIAPSSRVVYVDNDPIVLVHASALMKSTPEGRTAYIEADLREPETILSHPRLHDTLDLSQPVALSLIGMVQFVLDKDDPHGIVARLMRDLARGSFLAVSIFSGDTNPEQIAAVVSEYAGRGIPIQTRNRTEAERFFDGLELIEPGVRLVHHWLPEHARDAARVRDADVAGYGGVAMKSTASPRL